MVHKYSDEGLATAVLANANRGGENVHSGLVLGAAIGAGLGGSQIPAELKEGLREHQAIEKEIADFVVAVTSKL